jgi:hypothetical protein
MNAMIVVQKVQDNQITVIGGGKSGTGSRFSIARLSETPAAK